LGVVQNLRRNKSVHTNIISTALRSGVNSEEIANELQGIRSPKVVGDEGEQINSIADAITSAMCCYLDGEIDKAYPKQATNTNETAPTSKTTSDTKETVSTSGTPESPNGDSNTATQSLIESGESPGCSECSSMTLYYSEGCKTCESWGWSEC
jgi:ribonucleoside-diphosphate reductase alpha chain